MRRVCVVKVMVLVMAAVLAFTSCGSKAEILPEPSAGPEQPSESFVSETSSYSGEETGTETEAAEAQEPEEHHNTNVSYENIDIDLTVMSPTMIYSNVYNMMITPAEYFDKVIRLRGEYAYYYDEETEKTYYAVIIPDATACCEQGVEFVLADETAYPESAETVTVTGVFTTYEEDGFRYLSLADAVLEVEDA